MSDSRSPDTELQQSLLLVQSQPATLCCLVRYWNCYRQNDSAVCREAKCASTPPTQDRAAEIDFRNHNLRSDREIENLNECSGSNPSSLPDRVCLDSESRHANYLLGSCPPGIRRTPSHIDLKNSRQPHRPKRK